MSPVFLVVWVAQQTPEDDDVVAGWTGALVIGLLVVALVLLGFSLTKQLRKADKAEEAGLYDPSGKKTRGPAGEQGQQHADRPAAPDEPGE